MAINLFTLNATEATLVRPASEPVAYRINTDKIKENWSQLKSESKDMIQISAVSLSELKNVGEIKRPDCNYSLEAFFRKDMPKITTNGEYMVGGVTFTKEELEKCRMVMNTAVEGIGNGVGNIDYENYARMGIAVSGVKAYADANYTEEQAAVINRAMNEYKEALINAEKEFMSDGSYVDSQFGSVSNYYGKVRILNEDDAKVLNDLKAEISKLTGRTYQPYQSGFAVLVQSATNTELISEITDMFSNVDISDKEALSSVIERYKELMRPAYTAYGLNDTHSSLTKVLNEDVKSFESQVTNILLAANYHAADYSV